MPHSCTAQINLYGHACCNITFNDKQFSTCILVIYFCSVWCRGGTGSLGREAWYLNICPGTYLSFHSWGRGGNWSFRSSTPSLSGRHDNWLGVTLLVGGICALTFRNEFCNAWNWLDGVANSQYDWKVECPQTYSVSALNYMYNVMYNRAKVILCACTL